MFMAVKMRGIFCALAALLLAAAWADHHQHHCSNHSHEEEPRCSKVSPRNADFAFALYKSLNANTAAGKNIFFSPLGISTALSMLSTGAGGETHSQLFSSLGYSTLNQTQVNEEYKCLFHMFGRSQEDQRLDVGNAVALRSGFNPLETFLNDVRHYYSGEVFNVNLTKPAEAAAEINTFIANKSKDKTKDMVKDLDPDMAMVLINYVYFKAQWKDLFNPGWTHKGNFHVNKTTKVQVPLMMRKGYYDHYWDSENQTTFVMLHYKGDTSMMIVLPDEGKMEEVEGYINKEYIVYCRNSASMEYLELSLPRFSISGDASLENTLQEMGITNAFGDNANFSGMSNEAKLKVSKVSHKAVLSVSEMGTEPATANILEPNPLPFAITVTINRPFLVLVLEELTGSILFMGKISNPTAM